jgi:hypothetical protein
MPIVVKLLKDTVCACYWNVSTHLWQTLSALASPNPACSTSFQYHEVRLNIVSKLADLHAVIGADQLASTVVPQVASMAKDPQWRVRLALVEQLPMIAASIGQSTFDSKLLGLVQVR